MSSCGRGCSGKKPSARSTACPARASSPWTSWSESATAKAARESLEAQASGPPGPQRDMARAMLAQLQKDPHAELVLQREKQLKELWDAKEEAAAKTQALPPASPRKP